MLVFADSHPVGGTLMLLAMFTLPWLVVIPTLRRRYGPGWRDALRTYRAIDRRGPTPEGVNQFTDAFRLLGYALMSLILVPVGLWDLIRRLW